MQLVMIYLMALDGILSFDALTCGPSQPGILGATSKGRNREKAGLKKCLPKTAWAVLAVPSIHVYVGL